MLTPLARLTGVTLNLEPNNEKNAHDIVRLFNKNDNHKWYDIPFYVLSCCELRTYAL